MAKSDVKKDKVTTEDEAELVSVEMTPEQRDRIVRILADEKLEKVEAKPEGVFSMHLIYRHRINGKVYGPGNKVEVPESLVGHLQVAEQRSKDAELSLNTSSNRVYEVLQSGQSVPVRIK